jgi:hypothetical protein
MATKTITAARPLRPGLSLSGLAERILAFDSLWRQRRALAALDSNHGSRTSGFAPKRP